MAVHGTRDAEARLCPLEPGPLLLDESGHESEVEVRGDDDGQPVVGAEAQSCVLRACASADPVASAWRGRPFSLHANNLPGGASRLVAGASETQRPDRRDDEPGVVAPIDAGHVDVELDLVPVGVLEVETVGNRMVARTPDRDARPFQGGDRFA